MFYKSLRIEVKYSDWFAGNGKRKSIQSLENTVAIDDSSNIVDCTQIDRFLSFWKPTREKTVCESRNAHKMFINKKSSEARSRTITLLRFVNCRIALLSLKSFVVNIYTMNVPLKNDRIPRICEIGVYSDLSTKNQPLTHFPPQLTKNRNSQLVMRFLYLIPTLNTA